MVLQDHTRSNDNQEPHCVLVKEEAHKLTSVDADIVEIYRSGNLRGEGVYVWSELGLLQKRVSEIE
eukprot:COSAG02_NODE_1006_length_15265_cov_58.666886_12_plen_66_part_00